MFKAHYLLKACRYVCALLLLVHGSLSSAAELRIAVASNFIPTMQMLVKEFEASSEHRITMITGSTGKHYAQIKNGAPFDMFFSADSERIALLEQEGLLVSGTRFTYAQGKLVLWSPQPDLVDSEGQVLADKRFRHLAIANPQHAPYGVAAMQVLQQAGLWQELQQNIVRGENINQAFQFVQSGNAELGFVALSQLEQHRIKNGAPLPGSLWQVPQPLYSPVTQQAAILRDSAAAQAFLAFIRSDKAAAIIQDYGYETP